MARIKNPFSEKLLLGLVLNWLCLAFPLELAAQYDFHNPSSTYDSEDGLPNHYFKVMEKDNLGFVWIGTYDGLSRFDGSQFKTYHNDPDNPNSISSSGINDITVDHKRNEMWVATFKGLNKYDPKTDSFTAYYQNNEDSTSIPTNYVSSVLADRQGEIWATSNSNLLSKYNREKDIFEHFTPKQDQSSNFMGGKFTNTFIEIQQDNENDSILWLAQNDKVLSFNKYTNTFKLLLDSINSYRAFYMHPNGNAYLAEGRGIVKVLDKSTGAVKQSLVIDSGWSLREFFYKSDHELWVTANAGLAAIDLTSNEITFKKRNDSKNKVYYDIDYVDEKQRIWAGTLVGLRIYDPMSTQFKNYKYEASQETFYYITEDVVEDPHTGIIYMNVFSGDGLYAFDREKESWSVIPPPPSYKSGSFFGRGTLWSKKEDRLLILSPGQIYTLSKDKKSMVPIESKAQLSNRDRWFNFFEDHLGKLWLVGEENGVIRVDMQNGQIDTLNQYMPKCTEARYRVAFYQDKRHNVWVSGCNGHMVYSYEKNEFYTFSYDESDSESKTFFRVRGFQEDNEGQVWLSSNNAELGLVDPDTPEKGVYKKFPLKEWILSDSTKIKKNIGTQVNWLAEVVKDNAGNLWVLSQAGLIKFNPSTFAIEVYDQDDGLQLFDEDMKVHTLNELTRLSDGTLLVGFRKGLGMVDPTQLKTNEEAPKPYITAFYVYNEAKITPDNLLYTSGIDLNYDENFFSIEFSSINFTNPDKVKYQYKLEGVDKEWIEAGNRNYATYTNIDGGRYTFKIKAANSDGIWSEAPYEFAINVATPWWKTAWFRVLMFLFFGGIAYLIYLYRVRQVRKEERMKANFDKKLANVEMTALRAQMNPHFIFNCLNSIDYYIVKNETQKASDYLNSFSRLIRLILQNSRSNYVNLKDELEALRLYMKMESLRFDDKFEYEIDVEGNIDLEAIEIPPMLLQPYIENAIWHGLMHKKGSGKVRLKLCKRGENIICYIEDNGIGREKAMEYKSKSSTKRKSMGMQITKDRINMINKLYDSNTNVEIIDLKDVEGQALGTRVELIIPI